MKIRIFRCKCNHHLAFGKSVCSYCFDPTPFYNRVWFLVLLLLLAGIAYLAFAPV